MRITHMLFNRKNKGVSTILGTLIFIGIIFTSVVPMMLVMKQADTIYEKKKHEMDVIDDESVREELVVYTYDGGGTSIMVQVENRGDVPVNIVRVWTNNEYHDASEMISANSEVDLGPFTVPGVTENSVVDTKVVTERGNAFYSISGNLYYSGGGWSTTSYGICVIVHNPMGGKFQVFFYNGTHWEDPPFYESHAKEWVDVVTSTSVSTPSVDYRIDVKEQVGSNWVSLPGSPIDTPIEYPNGPPFLLVWMDVT